MKKYMSIGIIFSILVIIAVVIGWNAYPAWHSPSSGGFWALLLAAIYGVMKILKDGISILNDWKELTKDEEETSPPPLAPIQHIEKQEAENIYNAPGGTINVLPTPKEEPKTPDSWHLKHRYALTGNFTGRKTEKKLLSAWLNEKETPLLILRALGGFGKSALSWHWLLHDVDKSKWTSAVWWSFYEGDSSFSSFLSDTLEYLLGKDIELPSSPRLQVGMLLKELEKPHILLVMDGFERALRAYSSMNAAYQEDVEDESPLPLLGEGQGEGRNEDDRRRDCLSPAADEFLRKLASSAGIIQSKVLMSTRLTPRAVEPKGQFLEGVKEKDLTELSPEDAVLFFKNQGIKGTRAEIEAVCKPYGYHPLTLSILAGFVLGNREKPNDISVAAALNITDDIIQNKHHVLEVAYNSLASEESKLLSTIACFRSPTSYDALKSIATDSPLPNGGTLSGMLREGVGGGGLDNNLSQLEQRGLLHWDKSNNKYDLHPIVRRYAYERLTAPDRTAAHTRLCDYFEAVPKKEKIESLNDLAPVIELYHHMVRAGQFDEARVLFRDRLHNVIYYQLGAYQSIIELILSLFIDGEDKLPRLSDESAQTWTLNALANSYSLNGEPRRAVSFFEQAIKMGEEKRDKKNLAIGLGNVAQIQLILGALGDAERNLRRSIDLCRGIEDEFWEAVGHQNLGCTLAYRGAWTEAEQELDKTLRLFDDNRKGVRAHWMGITFSYFGLRLLLVSRMSKKIFADEALENINKAVKFMEEFSRTNYPIEREYVYNHWLLGASHRVNNNLEKSEKHLSESLRRCRAINLVEMEADILLEVAKLRHTLGESKEALRLAQEALVITERSGYLLQGADVNLFLAELALTPNPSPLGRGESDQREGGVREAREYAQKALKLAHCDEGPPYHYKVAYEEAERFLARLEK